MAICFAGICAAIQTSILGTNACALALHRVLPEGRAYLTEP